MELHRKSRKRDERATGAGDQAHFDYMKALDRALQAEDDYLEFASREEGDLKGEEGQVGADDGQGQGDAWQGLPDEGE